MPLCTGEGSGRRRRPGRGRGWRPGSGRRRRGPGAGLAVFVAGLSPPPAGAPAGPRSTSARRAVGRPREHDAHVLCAAAPPSVRTHRRCRAITTRTRCVRRRRATGHRRSGPRAGTGSPPQTVISPGGCGPFGHDAAGLHRDRAVRLLVDRLPRHVGGRGERRATRASDGGRAMLGDHVASPCASWTRALARARPPCSRRPQPGASRSRPRSARKMASSAM